MKGIDSGNCHDHVWVYKGYAGPTKELDMVLLYDGGLIVGVVHAYISNVSNHACECPLEHKKQGHVYDL